MRKTAGILKGCCTFAIVIACLALVLLVIAEAALLMAGSFSSLAEKAGNALVINGGTLTPEELDAFKPILLIVLGLGIVTIVLAILGAIKTRTALNECKEERPFSQKSVDAIKNSARLQILGGIIGIVGTILIAVMASGLTINGRPVASSSGSFNLSFLFYAIEKYLLFHIAEYGHSLENDSQKM